jgi:hypothetical protein
VGGRVSGEEIIVMGGLSDEDAYPRSCLLLLFPCSLLLLLLRSLSVSFATYCSCLPDLALTL